MGRIVRLVNRIQPYPWGSRTAIPHLMGEAPGEDPRAELWIGAHPRAPSAVLDADAQPLDAWLADDPEARIGAEVHARFGGLPFLLKYLAAEQPLSIQCHPNAAQARAGFAREEAAGIPRDAGTRTYRDPNPKPELMLARGRFEALRGFRAPDRIAEMLGALGVAEVDALVEPLTQDPSSAGLERFYRGLWSQDRAAQTRVAERAVLAAGPLEARDPAFAWVLRLGAAYPGDLGVLSPLILEHVVLEPGQALYLGAGELHAYLRGEGVEIMASSDNVVRGGLTQKHIDVPELLELLDYAHRPVQILGPTEVAPGLGEYRTPSEHFALGLVQPGAGEVSLGGLGRPAALFAVQGALTIEADGEAHPLPSGHAVFVPADAGPVTVRGEGEAVWATVPPLRA